VTVRVEAAKPRFIRFDATTTNISQGESSTLACTTENATRVSINGVGDNLPPNGTRVVTPTATTTYTLTAFGADGNQTTSVAIVTVGAGQVARILQFSAIPQRIDAGQSAQLCWQVENATEVTISGGVGAVRASDCVSVSPNATTTYTLTATNAAGQVSASAIVQVGGETRILTFSASPDFSHKSGDPVTLSWTTQDATSVVITGTGVPAGPLPVNGSLVVNPTTNSTYTLIASGPNGQISAVLLVFVR
jgi:hypothetical protein